MKGRLKSSRAGRYSCQPCQSSLSRAQTSKGWFSPFQRAKCSLYCSGSAIGQTSASRIVISPSISMFVVPAQRLGIRASQGVLRREDRLPVQFVVVPPVVELLLDAAAYL